MLASTTRRRSLSSESRAWRKNRAPRAPPWRSRRPSPRAAVAPDAAADAAPAPTTTLTLSTLLRPLIAQSTPRLLPAAIFWDADNVRPSLSGSNHTSDRRGAVRRALAALSAQLRTAGCRVDACAAYGNAATLGNGGDDDEEDDTSLVRIVVTTTSKRQSADMALLSHLAAFVRRCSTTEPQPQEQQNTPTCLILLIADDAGYAQTCAWAASAPQNAAIIACGASAAKRARYALPSSPLEPWRFHPVAKAGAAAVVVPWVVVGDEEEEFDINNNLDVGAAWVNSEGVFGGSGG